MVQRPVVVRGSTAFGLDADTLLILLENWVFKLGVDPHLDLSKRLCGENVLGQILFHWVNFNL